MSNDKIWAYSNTGNLAHAFVAPWTDKDGNESSEHLRAMCRKTIARHAFGSFNERKHMLLGLCANCVKLADAMHDRYDASLEPATEAHDLGYVPTGDADSLNDEQRERLQAGFDAAVAAHQAAPAAVTPELVTIGKRAVETLADVTPCCEHATMHHGHSGCDLCRCSTSRSSQSAHGGAAETVTIGGQPVETLADAEALLVQELRAERSQSVAAVTSRVVEQHRVETLGTAHAEALEMDETETLRVKLVGTIFAPTVSNLTWNPSCRAEVTGVVPGRNGRLPRIRHRVTEGEETWELSLPLDTFLLGWARELQPEPEAKPVRWHYRARRQTSQGAFLGILEGYISHPDEIDAAVAIERRLRLAFVPTGGTRLGNFTIRKA